MTQFLTWDTGIVAALGILLAYSLLIRKHKALATLISVYIAYTMASVWGERVVEFFAGDRVLLGQVWIQANASPFVIQSLLMILIAFLISSFIKLGGRRSKYSMPEVTVYAISTVVLTVMFMLTFMDAAMLDQVSKTSRIIPTIYQFREWILVIPVFIIIFFGIYGNEDV